MSQVFWQASARFRGELTGHGPSRAGATGCVWMTLVHLARALTEAKTLDPLVAMQKLRETPGAFVVGGNGPHASDPGDELVWPIAAPVFGLAVGDAVTAQAGSPSLALALEQALREGGAAVRVKRCDGKPDDTGHTIAALSRGMSGVHCVCSALADVVDLTWPALDNLDVHWGAIPHPYHVVGVRPVRAAAN